MEIEIKKINSVEEKEPKNVIKQIEEIIGSEEILLKQEIEKRINYTNWKEDISTKSSWEEAKNYGNQILALILIHQELIAAEEAIKGEEWETIDKRISRLREVLLLNDTDLKAVLNNWTFEGNNYEEKLNKILSRCENKLTELEEDIEDEEEEGDRWIFDEKKIKTFLKEIENLCKERGVIDEQINDELRIKLRSGMVGSYQELIKRKVHSQEKLEEWRDRLTKIIRYVELKEKRKRAMTRDEFKIIQGEIDRLAYRGMYSIMWEEAFEEIPLKKTIKKNETLADFRAKFGIGGARTKEKRTITKNKQEEASEKVAEEWYKVSSELGLSAEGSLVAWKNGWNPPGEKDFKRKRKDLPYNKPKALGIWVKEFEKVEKKEKKISTDEIVKWWEHSQETGLKAKESANAWSNGWNYNEIKNGRGSITPNVEESFNIPVDQKKSLAEEKDKAKVELIEFFWFPGIGKEEGSKLESYKEGIDKATKSEEVQRLLKDYIREIVSDQIKYKLDNSTFSIQESDLTTESQDSIRTLADGSTSSEVETTKKTRNSVLQDIETIEEKFSIKKILRELFVGEVKDRLELIEKNSWKISFEKIDEKEWDDYIINGLDIRNDDIDAYQKVNSDLITKLKGEVEKTDNEGKTWEPAFTNEDWEELEKNFIYSKVADEEEIETIDVGSVVAAVKRLAVNRWKKKIEEKISLAKEMIEKEERTDSEVEKLIDELDSIAKWDEEGSDSNQKEALQDKKKEFHAQLESLKYEFYLSIIKKAEELPEIDEIEGKIRKNMKGEHLPPEKKVSNLHQDLNNQKALINLKGIVNDKVIPTEVEEINEQLSKLLICATAAERNAYHELNKEGAVDKKELELKKAKYLKVNNKEEKWKYDLTEEQKGLIRNSEDKAKLSASLREIEKHFQFLTEFYDSAKITPSPENNQLIAEYRKIKRLGGRKAGLIYKDGWEDPSKINEEGLATLDEGNSYPYDVRNISRLQAEIMEELQKKIDEVKKTIDTATSEKRASLLKELLSFNEEWIEEGGDESIQKARQEALNQKRSKLEQALRDLFGKEIRSIWDDMLDEEKYGKDYNKLEELVGDRIKALDDKHVDNEGRSKDSLNKIKEAIKNRLKFRADFLEVSGDNKGEELSDEFIYSYQNKGLDGQKAGKVYYENGWTDPAEIGSDGYANFLRGDRYYPFLVVGISRQEAEERVAAEEKLHEIIYRPEAKDSLEKLKSHLSDLENLIPQNEPTEDQSLTPVQRAYQNNKKMADSKRAELVEIINNLQKQSFIDKINDSVQKINNIFQGQGVELIENESTSVPLSEWKEWINDKDTNLKEIGERIKEELTIEICALLINRLEELREVEPTIGYEELGISTNIRGHFSGKSYELTELADEGSRIARKITDIRNKQEESAIDILKKLINKKESEDLETLRSELNNLRDLIPVDITERESLTGKQLTFAEVDAYKENRDEADEKELSLLKKITKQEGEKWEPSLREDEWKAMEKAKNKVQFESIKRQFIYEREIDVVLKDSEIALKNEETQKSQLLGLTYTLDGFNKLQRDGSQHDDIEIEEVRAWRNKKKQVQEMIKRLKVKIAEHEFDEHIGKIAKENDPSALDNLGKKWTEKLRQEKIFDDQMPDGKKKKNLLAEIEKRKVEIRGGKISQTEEEKSEEIRNERDNLRKKINAFKEQLGKGGVVFEENNWDSKVLEALDEKNSLEEKKRKAEKILGVSLENLENENPSLVNLIEIANSLTKIGIDLEKDENGRCYYSPEKLRNKLAELIKKEGENDLLRGTIGDKEKKISDFNNELGKMETEKETLNNEKKSLSKDKEEIKQELQKKEKELEDKKTEVSQQKDDIKDKKKKIKELEDERDKARKQVEDLEKLISENSRQQKILEKELEKTRIINELSRSKLISEWGDDWEQLEAKIEASISK